MGGFPRKLFVTGLAHFSQPKGVGSVSQNERFVEVAGPQKIKEIRKVRYTEQLGGNGKKLRGETPYCHSSKTYGQDRQRVYGRANWCAKRVVCRKNVLTRLHFTSPQSAHGTQSSRYLKLVEGGVQSWGFRNPPSNCDALSPEF